MDTHAVLLSGPRQLTLSPLGLLDPQDDDVIVETHFSGISTGTEKLFWTGEMPPFPGMGYPLVPGYEAVGEVVEARPRSHLKPGDHVFVPGASCYAGAHALFGASSSRIVVPAKRVTAIDPSLGADGTLLALAATARHAMAGLHNSPPELIIGHGVLGRLLARLTLAAGAPPPTVHEIDPGRIVDGLEYPVLHPDDDPRTDYATIYDASGCGAELDGFLSRLSRGGEVVLAGFYAQPLTFSYASAFMREARLRIAAEFTAEDIRATHALVQSGQLSLADLITHQRPAADAPAAYRTAFDDADCLKMILNWKGLA